ncbi:aspartyl-phosphate phosphatase Spo0E family protein [Staphylospora marina]|uniref:aspartyl-phosphate phosphatase Spo0E family protein n=1 Tax=Staphylospora marina TaxID=2490858 RepID=UPI001F154C83|nr:aspartyl-phosphate phosphatase Spo0E family protein [Staphylospora marina]
MTTDVWKRTLEHRMEMVRRQMEETAGQLGIGHPAVYRLSLELDRLHNEWEQWAARERNRRESRYCCAHGGCQVRETPDYLYFRVRAM